MALTHAQMHSGHALAPKQHPSCSETSFRCDGCLLVNETCTLPAHMQRARQKPVSC